MAKLAICASLFFCFLATGSLSMQAVSSEREFDHIVDNSPNRLVAVSFGSPRCGESCELMTQSFLELSKAHFSNAEFLTIDCDKVVAVALVAGIEAVPTVLFYFNGLQVGHVEGTDEAERLPHAFEAALKLARPCKPAAKAGPMSGLPRWLSDLGDFCRDGFLTFCLPDSKALPTCKAPDADPALQPAVVAPAVGVIPVEVAPKAHSSAARTGAAKLVRSQAQELAQPVAEHTKAVEYMRAPAFAQAQAHAEAQAAAQRHIPMQQVYRVASPHADFTQGHAHLQPQVLQPHVWAQMQPHVLQPASMQSWMHAAR